MFVAMLFFIIFPIVGVMIFFLLKSEEKSRLNWAKAAKKLHLKFSPGTLFSSGRIHGRHKGHNISISTFTRSSGKSSTTYMKYIITYNKKIPAVFTLTKQSFIHGLGKLFGMQDVELGDSSFDDNVLVHGKNPAAIARFLTAPRRKHIKKAILLFPEVTITDKSITVVIRGRDRDSKTIVSRVHYLYSLSNAIVKEYDKDHPINKVKIARKRGEVKQAIEIIQASAFEDADEKLEAKEQKAELLYIADKKEKAAEIFDELAKEMPDDISAHKWRDFSEKTEELPVEEVCGDNMLTAETVSKELFDAGLTSTFDITGMFEKTFKDKKIKWTGIVENAAKFNYDYIFKNKKGVKLTVNIYELESAFGSPKVHTIVHFPAELYETLKNMKNKKITFSGRMTDVDALMHNLYISEGEILDAC